MVLEEIIEAITALFLVIVFLVIILPALGEATGANMTFGIIAFLILAIGIIGIIIGLIKRE